MEPQEDRTTAKALPDFRQPCRGIHTQLEDLLSLRFAAQELHLHVRRLSQAPLAGSTRTRHRGRGMEFEEVRLYQPGDDIRTIDWRVTARTQVPHTKLFREERERPVMLMLDQRASLHFGSRHCFKSVLAAHSAALLAWAALAQNDRIGGLIFNDLRERDIRPKRSRHSVLTLLQAVQEFNAELHTPVAPVGAIPLRQRLTDLRRVCKPGSAIVILSDCHDWDDDCTEQLHHLSRLGELFLLWITDPLEQELPLGKNLTVTDGQHRRTIDTSSAALVESFRTQQLQLQQQLQLATRQTATQLLTLSTAASPLEQLQTLFGKRPCLR